MTGTLDFDKSEPKLALLRYRTVNLYTSIYCILSLKYYSIAVQISESGDQNALLYALTAKSRHSKFYDWNGFSNKIVYLKIEK